MREEGKKRHKEEVAARKAEREAKKAQEMAKKVAQKGIKKSLGWCQKKRE